MMDLMMALVVLGAGVLAFVVPKRWLLPAVLVVLAVYPRKFYGDNRFLEFAAVPLVLIGVWVLRSGTQRLAIQWNTSSAGKAAAQRLAFLLGCWCFLLTVVSVAPVTSFKWSAVLILSVTLLVLVPPSSADVGLIKGTWVAVGAFSAVYSILEFVLQMNPVYDVLYEAVGASPVQHWSVYRPSAGFGHPLYAGLFMSTAAALALGEALSRNRHRAAYTAGAVACTLGTALTASRSALAAVAVAGAVVLVLSILGMGRLSPFAKIAFAGVSAAVVWSVYRLPSLQERLGSEEAESSWQVRFTLLNISLAATEERWYLGSGPGTSAIAIEPYNPQNLLLESSLLQLLVSLGIVGLVLVLSLIALSLFSAARRGELGLVGLLIAYCVSTFGFNAIDSNRVYLVPLGLAFSMLWSYTYRRPEETHQAPRRSSNLSAPVGARPTERQGRTT